jgi:hypothetical protein
MICLRTTAHAGFIDALLPTTALTPDYAQASAQVPQPSQPSTDSPMSLALVSPYSQQRSTKPLAAPAAHSPCHNMGGECPRARPCNCLHRLMAPSPMSFGASTPSYSPHHFVPSGIMGGMYSVGRQGQLDMVLAKGCWHPCPLPQGRQGHHQARPILSRQLGHLPPTHQQWGGGLPWRHAMLWVGLTRHTPHPLSPLQMNRICSWHD